MEPSHLLAIAGSAPSHSIGPLINPILRLPSESKYSTAVRAPP